MFIVVPHVANRQADPQLTASGEAGPTPLTSKQKQMVEKFLEDFRVSREEALAFLQEFNFDYNLSCERFLAWFYYSFDAHFHCCVGIIWFAL
jgi:hypothetical protein